MSKLKVTALPEYLRLGDKIKLIDFSWSILFPEYWVIYREKASSINIATIVVETPLGNDEYSIGIVDIVPDEGRVRLPVGLKATANIKTIQMAIALSYKLMRDCK